MGNMPDIQDTQLTVRMPLKLYRKIDKHAKVCNMSKAEVVNVILERELKRVQLTAEDVDWINERMKANVSKRG